MILSSPLTLRAFSRRERSRILDLKSNVFCPRFRKWLGDLQLSDFRLLLLYRPLPRKSFIDSDKKSFVFECGLCSSKQLGLETGKWCRLQMDWSRFRPTSPNVALTLFLVVFLLLFFSKAFSAFHMEGNFVLYILVNYFPPGFRLVGQL